MNSMTLYRPLVRFNLDKRLERFLSSSTSSFQRFVSTSTPFSIPMVEEKQSIPTSALVPPFSRETAEKKVKLAQDLWNTMNAKKVSMAYTEDSKWRNRDQFFQGRQAIEEFLEKKWEKETEYRLKKRLFAFEGNRIAVQFWYEYHNRVEKSWKRTYGLEHWTFAADGLMKKRHMSGNEVKISESDRWFTEGVDVDRVNISERDG